MSILLEAFADGLKPSTDLGIVGWCEKHVDLPFSARAQKFDCSYSPWLRQILEAIGDNRNKQVVVKAPTGGGKTTLFEALAMYVPVEDPGNMLIVFQTDNEAKEWSDTRLDKVVDACKPLQAFLPADRHKRKKTEIIFPHMDLIIGAANYSTLQSKSIRWVIMNEVWLYKRGMIGEAKKRTHDRWNSRLILCSQGSFEGDDFDNEFNEGTIYVYHWRCEGCDNLIEWKFDDIKYTKIYGDDGKCDINETQKTVFMECPECQKQYSNDGRTRRRLSTQSEYVITKHGLSRHVSFNLSAECLWYVDWAELVKEFINAQNKIALGDKSALQQFVQKREAKTWKHETEEAREALMLSTYSKSEYLDGKKINDEFCRFLTVDVQQDHFWFCCRAWRQDGSSMLISEGKALTFETLESLRIQYKVNPQCLLIDSQYRTDEIYKHCAYYKWIALKGADKLGFDTITKTGKKVLKPYSKIATAQTTAGTHAKYLYWSNESIKDLLVILRNGESHEWALPSDLSDDFKTQIDSESKKEVIDKATGNVKLRWVRTKKHNHLWDCECMQLVGAIIFGLISKDE